MQNVNIDITPGSFLQTIRASQYDVGREFKLNVVGFDIPTGAVAQIVATKPSGLGFTVNGTVTENTVTFTTTETMTNENGSFAAELRISLDGVDIGTSNFIFNIERSPHPEGTTDGDAETLIPELTLLVNEIRESNAKVESMTASATSLTAGSDPTAEYDSENNNLAFGIPVPEVTAEDLYKAFIIKSASGEIASFSDGGDDLPMKSLKVNIVPKQDGSGDPSPSNVRPISGWDSVDVHVSATTSGGSTITTNLGQTVYGGTLDVMSGKLTITKAMVDLGSFDWASRSDPDRHIFRTLVNGLNPAIAYPQNSNIPTTAICEQYKAMGYSPISASDNYKFAIGTLEDPLLVIIDFDYSTAEDFKTAMNGVKLVYPLATPIEVTLTPTQVKTLLGSNNIWSESGTVEVEYRADSTLAYEELANAIISLGGNI